MFHYSTVRLKSGSPHHTDLEDTPFDPSTLLLLGYRAELPKKSFPQALPAVLGLDVEIFELDVGQRGEGGSVV